MNISSGEEAYIKPIPVKVPARYTIAQDEMQNFLNLKYGLFVHYVPALTVNSDGTKIMNRAGYSYEENLSEFAEAFDVDQFVQDVKDMNVQYVIFTAWHAQMIALYPSEVMKNYGLENHQVSDRDLIGEIIDRLNAEGIDVFLYTHPRDGHDMSDEEAASVGWVKTNPNDGNPDFDKFDYERWNNFINDVYGELIDRYGSGISGLFVDEGSSLADSYRVVDYDRLIHTIKSRNPDLMLMHNFYGTTYGLDLGMKEFFNWCEFASADSTQWPAFEIPAAVGLSSAGWWAGAASGTDVCKYSAEDMFRYTVLQSSVNAKGGGTAWAAGPYPYGQGWEKNIKENMVRVGELLEPIEESVIGTRPSEAFVTKSGTTLGIADFVANTSSDGTKEYIHILNAPAEGNRIELGIPADGSVFEAKAEALNDGAEFNVITDDNGKVILEFANDRTWSDLTEEQRLDYVVVLTVKDQTVPEYVYEYIDNTDTSIRYAGGTWTYQRWERNKVYNREWGTTTGGDYEADIHESAGNGAYFEVPFTGTGIAYMPCTNGSNTDSCSIYIDGEQVAENISLRTDTYIPQNEVFSIQDLENGSHMLKVVNTGSGKLINDVVRVIKPAENPEDPENPVDPVDPEEPDNPDDNTDHPANNDDPDKTAQENSDKDSVKDHNQNGSQTGVHNVLTGDDSRPAVWIAVMIAALGAAVFLVKKRRR